LGIVLIFILILVDSRFRFQYGNKRKNEIFKHSVAAKYHDKNKKKID